MLRLLALLALLAPALACAQAGRFLLAAGEVSIQRGGAQVRAAVGTPVERGDTVTVGPASNAQIRFTDESIVSLRSGTVFRIDEYFYSGKVDGQERTLLRLIKGGLRTVTGWIGRSNRERYEVQTPTATIGIRGTHYTIVHCDNDCVRPQRPGLGAPQAPDPSLNGTSGGVTDGRIGVKNQVDNREFGAREYFRVLAANTPIEALIGPPPHLSDRLGGQQRNVGQRGQASTDGMAASGIEAESRPSETPSPPAPNSFIVTEQRTSTGESVVLSARPDTGFLLSLISGVGDDLAAGGALISQSNFVPGANVLQSYSVPAGCIGPNPDCAAGASGTLGMPAQAGSAMFPSSTQSVFWGAWDSGNINDGGTPITLSPAQQAHFIYGPLTPSETIAAKTGTLVLTSGFPGLGTIPSNNFGMLASSATFPSISVNFTTQGITHTGGSVLFPTSGIPNTDQTWTMGAGAGSLVVQGGGAFFRLEPTGTCSSSGAGCNGSVGFLADFRISGIFVGPAGDHAAAAVAGVAGTSQFSAVRVYCPTC